MLKSVFLLPGKKATVCAGGYSGLNVLDGMADPVRRDGNFFAITIKLSGCGKIIIFRRLIDAAV